MPKLFLHGVPDTPFMWSPLLEALHLDDADYVAPALPGFVEPAPRGFACTKEAYAAWLIAELETLTQRTGKPVDVVGHDWGALLVVHVANARPDLFRTWAVANAVPDPNYRWHRAARLWQTPLIGEFVMWASQFRDFAAGLTALGMPHDVARHKAKYWTRSMRRAILALYRSAKNAGVEWGSDLSNLPSRGLVLWGADDPFVTLQTAQRFCERWRTTLHTEQGVGHWGVIQRPHTFAARLQDHWR
jgi:pimeloyl-ACP methyl ester carboxylesterase